MSENFTVNSNKVPVEKSFNSQQLTTIAADLTSFEQVTVIPLSVEYDNSFEVPDVRNYDFVFASRGAVSGITRDVHYRSVFVPNNIDPATPLVFVGFFGETHQSGRLDVLTRESTDSGTIYDVFFHYPSQTGLDTLDLTIVSLQTPPGNLSTFVQIPTVGIHDSKTVERSINSVKTYDVFIIEQS